MAAREDRVNRMVLGQEISSLLRQHRERIDSTSARKLPEVTDRAEESIVVIQRHSAPRSAMISMDLLSMLDRYFLEQSEPLEARFNELLEEVKAGAGGKGLRAAFDAEPGEAGRKKLIASAR